ncbi:thiol reductant ABC exporter subunit CydD [Alkalibacillus haloalkaliphilus]|uniref:Thiol reductant ABC exporter subunit CydD n=1 Tax=Alkalibacillus haloalkaliphilus TaxID=94136 RepID=A0A511W3E8_9BACI|nr:thiol reductant ABC exporter subunit CydD [Alkalibacillus haloalkaliphilus]GEN45580.1 thiol reductant ABC exporter subunit CydD [Alkalibacillus haloalkaliphilus]
MLLKPLIKRQTYIQLSIVSIVMALTIIAQAYLIVSIIEAIFLSNASFSAILPSLGLLLFVISLRAGMNYLNGVIGLHAANQAKKKLRNRVLSHFTKQPVDLSSQGRSGEKVTQLINVVEQTDSYFSQYIPKMIQATIVPLAILAIIFTQNWVSGVIILLTAPFIPLFMAIIGMKTKDKSEEQLNELSSFSGQFLDSLQGLTTLKLFGQSDREKSRIEDSSINFRQATLGVLAVAFTSAFMMELISMLSMGLIALELALGLIIFDTITFATAFFILLLAPEFYIALKDLSSAFHSGRESLTASKKLEEQLNEPVEELTWGEASLTSRPPRIQLNGVSFAYDESETVQDVSATIEAGSFVAIVGKSGAGKTTLLHLIARLLPVHSGDIFVNDIEQDQLGEQAWFNELSYISQHPYIFSGTIYDNIQMSKPSATKEDIDHAAKEAGLQPLIDLLEDGLHTVIGEGGRGLSGGEKQRVALARAFLKQPSIILFDEPTTGLDLKTEQVLNESITKLAEDATLITVAHRMHTIQKADQIIVMDEGRVVGTGQHDMLRKSNATYQSLIGDVAGGERDGWS